MITVMRRVALLMAAQRAAAQAYSDVRFTVSPIGRAFSLTAERYSRGLWVFCAVLASTVAHLAAAVFVALVPLNLGDGFKYAPPRTYEFTQQPEEELLDEPEPNLDLALPDIAAHENVLSSLAMSSGPIENDDSELLSTFEPTTDQAIELVRDEVKQLEAFKLDEIVVEKGSVGQEITHVEGAVDRITYEIANNLEEQNLIIVWLMDASISLVEERQVVADNLQRVYQELEQLGGISDDAILSAVVAFGKGYVPIVEPTADGQAIIDGIRDMPIDESGEEMVFHSVAKTIDRYKTYITRQRRKMMIIVWTDESGDDYSVLEPTIAMCRRFNVPVFTVGPSAMFGREIGTRPYKHPEDGVVYHLPVNRGPDAVRQEQLRLPYWFRTEKKDGPLNKLHAGLGPFALTRLARESGGAYFVKDHPSDRSPIKLETMLHYLPDYDSPVEYVKNALASPLRSAVLNAVDVTYQMKFKGTPQLQFAPTGDTFQQDMLDAQKTVAYNEQVLEAALAAFQVKGLEKAYDEEKSARWRAWYDLTLGRLLAMRCRGNEYNWAAATMKGKGREFVDLKSNRWLFVPDEQLKFGSSSKKDAQEAKRLLTRCIENNPGTPWEQLAMRELKYPFGFTVQETYVAPPPPPKANPAAAVPVPPKPTFRPPPGLRTEKARMLQRKKKPKLPKL